MTEITPETLTELESLIVEATAELNNAMASGYNSAGIWAAKRGRALLRAQVALICALREAWAQEERYKTALRYITAKGLGISTDAAWAVLRAHNVAYVALAQPEPLEGP